jgi:hypothetical protein
VYLNPRIDGPQRAQAKVREAMQRIGFGAASRLLPALGPNDEPCYFSLDLKRDDAARVKVYVAHHRATGARIEDAVWTARGYVPGRAADFCERLAGTAGPPYDRRPVITCFSFVEGLDVPSAATIHFPIRSYAATDAEARQRIVSTMSEEAARSYESLLAAFAHRPLEASSGMQTYASLRLVDGPEHITVYLAPEEYSRRV